MVNVYHIIVPVTPDNRRFVRIFDTFLDYDEALKGFNELREEYNCAGCKIKKELSKQMELKSYTVNERD